MSLKSRNSLKQVMTKHPALYYLMFPRILIGRTLRWVKKFFFKRKSLQFERFYNSAFSKVKEGSLVVSALGFQGAFEIDFRSHILRRLLEFKEYEPNLLSLINTYIDPQRDVVDIGANIGLFTVLFSKKIAATNKVLSIEPTPLALEYLYRNIARNGCSQSVIVYEGIATNQKGNYELNIISGKEEYSSLGNIVHPSIQGEINQKIEVVGNTVDDLVNKFSLSPGFIKIDTEGAEYLVLSGALHTIQKYKPIILSELSDLLLSECGASSEMVINLLQINGYQVIDVAHPGDCIKTPFNGEILALPK